MWEYLRAGIPVLCLLPEWKVVSRSTLAELEPESLGRLFAQFEEYLSGHYGSYQASRISGRTRKEILDYLAVASPEVRFLRFEAIYATKLRTPQSPGRGLISDSILYANEEALPPVSALSHSTASELRLKTRQRLQSDLDRIAIACLRELDDYEIALRKFASLRAQHLKPKFLAWATGLTPYASGGGRLKRLPQRTLESMAILFLKVDAGLMEAPAFMREGYTFSDQVAPILCGKLEISPVPFENALRFDAHPPRTCLIACVLLLMIKTRWNVGAVMDLLSDSAKRATLPYEIQSIKSKTGDETPPVLIGEEDEGAVRAINFVERRLSLLKAREWVSKEERKLWLSPRREKGTGKTIQLSNLAQALLLFRLKHGLPRFSFEQVRDQALTIATLGRGGLAAGMESAGHSRLATLTSYVQGLITERLNAATNLEFQRRWDAAIRYRIESSSIEAGTRIVPIGDGASCVNPGVPPDESWLQLGACDAQKCHDGDGCPNRRLVINAHRVEEVVRTRQFYFGRWQQLASGNPQAFLRHHLPGMLFNLVLYEALKRGPYRHLIPNNA